jgi:hypothetical protein
VVDADDVSASGVSNVCWYNWPSTGDSENKKSHPSKAKKVNLPKLVYCPQQENPALCREVNPGFSH